MLRTSKLWIVLLGVVLWAFAATAARIRDSEDEVVRSTFDEVEAHGLRLFIHASHDDQHARIVELEVYAPDS
jgi:type IV secretory pathway TrbD component